MWSQRTAWTYGANERETCDFVFISIFLHASHCTQWQPYGMKVLMCINCKCITTRRDGFVEQYARSEKKKIAFTVVVICIRRCSTERWAAHSTAGKRKTKCKQLSSWPREIYVSNHHIIYPFNSHSSYHRPTLRSLYLFFNLHLIFHQFYIVVLSLCFVCRVCDSIRTVSAAAGHSSHIRFYCNS